LDFLEDIEEDVAIRKNINIYKGLKCAFIIKIRLKIP
jgi:hypothetical protein